MNGRVIPVGSIPDELWKKDTTYLPTKLVDAYSKHLEDYGLLATARSGTDKKDIFGGCNRDDTLEHFAHRFGVSCARIEFLSLDPITKFGEIPDAILSTFSEGHVAVLDIPCGPFSTALSMISTLAVLRKNEVLPRLPLSISLTGADCSETALEVGSSMLDEVQLLFEGQAIHVERQTQLWDATQAEDTARLIDSWFVHSGAAREFVVCISNFSGALIKAHLLEQFQPCLEHILARLYNRKSTLLWIEPVTSDAKEKLLPRIWDYIARRLPQFFGSARRDLIPFADYRLSNPLNAEIIRTGLAVQRFWRS